jgi:hypothetical protein
MDHLKPADIIVAATELIKRKDFWLVENKSTHWFAALFDAEGDFRTGGQGRTAAEAAAMAWVWTWHLCDEARLTRDDDGTWHRHADTWDGVMPEIEPGSRFELFPPGTWEDPSPEMDELWWGTHALPAAWVERRAAL